MQAHRTWRRPAGPTLGSLVVAALGCGQPVPPPRIDPPLAVETSVRAPTSAPPASAAPEAIPIATPRTWAPESARPTAESLRRALFADAAPPEALACAGSTRCVLATGYAADADARRLVLDLYDRFGTVVMPGEAETMAMSYRGTITVVPVHPIGAWSNHLRWVHAAFEAIASVLDASPASSIRFPAVVAFVRSLHGKHTPSAYAADWRYTYNVEGSLNVSEASVRTVAIHEMFHLVDDGWSERVLGHDVRDIVARCHATTTCLAPYSPTRLRVRGGTFYAFQPGNDIVGEYAAELATRILEEQRGRLGAGPTLAPFRCGPAPNGKVWTAMIHDFFGDVDRVPACP